MEEPQSLPQEGNDRSARTADMLRSLRAQAEAKLEDYRLRITDIEAQLTDRLQQISEEIARDRVAEEIEATATAELHAELEDLQRSFENSTAEVASLREQIDHQRDAHEVELGKRDEELGLLIEQHEQVEAERERLSQELQEYRTQAESESARLSQELQEQRHQSEAQNAGFTQELDEQRAEAEAERHRLSLELQDRQAEIERISQELQDSHQTVEDLRNQQLGDNEQFHSELGSLQQKLENARQEVAQLHDELGASKQALENVQVESETLRQRESNDSEAIRTELEQLRETIQEEKDELQALQEKHQVLEQTHTQTHEQLDLAQAKNREATFALQAAELRILELSNNHEQEQQVEQLNRKFELALADVHKLKRENAELHSELASRPEASDGESPELLSLRSERDALATRIAELENAPSQQTDIDVQQELSDLQRRFELAVDDVRDLKQENAQLKEQLQSGGGSGDAVPASDASDWQSQKARLLAALNAEDQGEITTDRREARATIEGTISITDQVVAEKDKEIAELQNSIGNGPSQEQLEQLKQSLREEIYSNDELIQDERQRLQEAQDEWQEKLRKAELELSVERAKLAREHSALEEKLATLQEASLDAVEDEGKPRRRWLSALGLKDDDEE